MTRPPYTGPTGAVVAPGARDAGPVAAAVIIDGANARRAYQIGGHVLQK
jgi:hypothetical protein